VALILLIEDESLLRWTLATRLTKAGHTVHSVESLAEADRHIGVHQPDLVLLDLSLPDGHGLDFYERNMERLEESVVLVMTAVGEVEDAVRAMKLGAVDFLSKPIEHDALIRLVERSLAVRSDRLEATAARQHRERELSQGIVAHSAAIRRTLTIAEEVAISGIDSILVDGESGTGKNVVARHIHATSPRHDRPFLEVNCAAIPEQLLESELFGHERGAFTDAKQTRQATFELANGGTVLLDEIGELRLDLQAKLLHFLEGRRFRRVGGVREIQVDVRIIALTNRDIRAMVQEKQFRGDLYFRLSVFPITVPSLRERPEDILPLANHFISTLQPKFGRTLSGLTRDAEVRLLGYGWPGNVRELRNVIERAMILEKGSRIGPASLILDYPGGSACRCGPARGGRARDGAARHGCSGRQPDPGRRAPRHQPRSAQVSAQEARPLRRHAHPAHRRAPSPVPNRNPTRPVGVQLEATGQVTAGGPGSGRAVRAARETVGRGRVRSCRHGCCTSARTSRRGPRARGHERAFVASGSTLRAAGGFVRGEEG